MRGGANLPLVSNYNRGVILEAIRSSGPVSRVELATITGLTPPTVSNIVRRLIDNELVVEAGQGPSTGGKPRTLLRLNPSARHAVGVQLGSEAITDVVSDLAGTTIARARRAGAGCSAPSAVVTRIADETSELLRETGLDPARVVGVGVASPGPLDHGRGVILTPPNLTHWHEFPLRDELSEAVGHPVLVDNDATAAAMGESWVGSAGTARTFACVYMGAGIGSGIFVDGHVHRGASSNAGEIGHTSIQPHGEICHCGNRGCLELYGAPRAVVGAARSDPAFAARLGLGTTARSVLSDFGRICDAAQQGDVVAAALVQRSADALATAVLNLVNVLDLELVVLTGEGLRAGGRLYLEPIERTLHYSAFARRTPRVVVRLSPIAADAAAVGAASLVLHSEFSPQMLGLRAVAGA